MSESAELVSKVLVLEHDIGCFDTIKKFCEQNNLVGLTVSQDNVMSVLRSNVDLGGILISEEYGTSVQGGILMSRRIHSLRPELPIFMRREKSASLAGMSAEDKNAISAVYTINQIDDLKPILDEFIFSLNYPNALVRGITDMTLSALNSQFKGLSIDVSTPYIVRDRMIFGEIFTLIPLESHWCRGYMMLQCEEIALLDMVKREKTHIDSAEANDFRNLNSVMGEITNLVWGAFKNRYLSYDKPVTSSSQVPIMVNHLHRYISFGSDYPQLCFKYTMVDNDDADASPLVLYQKFVFNLSWSPEDFAENTASVEDLLSAGELDLF